MAKKRNIVVKIGSALLANLELLTPRYGFLQRLLEDVAQLRAEGTNVILCSSGSVALGLRIIGETPESAGVSDKQAAAACGMPLLLKGILRPDDAERAVDVGDDVALLAGGGEVLPGDVGAGVGDQLVDLGLGEVTHTSRFNRDPKPGITTPEILSRSHDTISKFIPPQRSPSNIEKRLMTKLALEYLMRVSLEIHIYSFNGYITAIIWKCH